MRGVRTMQLNDPTVQVASIVGDHTATRVHISQSRSSTKVVNTSVITLDINQARELVSQLTEALHVLGAGNAKTR